MNGSQDHGHHSVEVRGVTRYPPTRVGPRWHPVPDWFGDAKLGIFIHSGLFSIPAFASRLASVSEASRRTTHSRLP